MKDRFARWLVVIMVPVLVAIMAVPCGAAKKKKTQVARVSASTPSKPSQPLIWPMPPAPPRIRWLDQFSKYSDVEPKEVKEEKKEKKRSWFERVAGVVEEEKKEVEPGLVRPSGIAVDSRGRIYVADIMAGRVVIFDRQAKQVETRASSARAAILAPVGVAVDEQDRLFVSDTRTRLITCFTPEGEPIAQFGSGELQRPTGMAIDRKRRLLYVADVKANQIAVYSTKTFKLLRTIGGPDKGGAFESGKFNAPGHVALDKDGNLYVTDTFSFRVQIFNRRGRFLRAFGSNGTRPGNFHRPKGIAVDSEGHIYVADGEFNNFQIFDQEGRVLMFVGSRGSDPGQFLLLMGLCIDEQDRIYTTEFVGRVQVFQYISQPDTSGAVAKRK